jgi:hypothetical protein
MGNSPALNSGSSIRPPLRSLPLSQTNATNSSIPTTAVLLKPTAVLGKPPVPMHPSACRSRTSQPPIPTGMSAGNLDPLIATAASAHGETHKCQQQCKIKQIHITYQDKSTYKGSDYKTHIAQCDSESVIP